MVIPHPSTTEFLVSLEIFLGLYIPKKILDVIFDRELKWMRRFSITAQRKLEIKLHVKQHGGPLKGCAECEALTSQAHLPVRL